MRYNLLYLLPMKRRITILFLFSFIVIAGAMLPLAAGVGLQRRLAAIPYYARAYLDERRPTVLPPTPPAISGQRRQILLAAAPPATPTPLPTVTAAPDTQAALELPPTPSPTVSPSPAATATALPEATSTPLHVTPAVGAVALGGVTHAWQLWNNCGPATIAMNLSFYGLDTDQRQAANVLKPNQDDKNVSPDELAAYARSQGFGAIVRVGGDLQLLRRLLSNRYPVIVETWLNPEDRGGMGHYRLLTGYDIASETFVAQDSLQGPDARVPFEALDDFWRVFNRTYIVVYRPQQADGVRTLLGPAADDQMMWENALATARQEARDDAGDPYAWFNLGASNFRLGQPELAADAFDEARRIGLPYRMLWYQFEIFEAYLAVGRHQDVAYLASATAYAAGGLEEAYYYQGLAYQALGQPEAAAEAFRDALDHNPSFTPAAEAQAELGGQESP